MRVGYRWSLAVGWGGSREGTPPLPRPPWLQSIAVVPRMCWGFWVAAILEACLTGPLCVCQMASVIGQLCPVTFGHCVPIVCAGEQTVQLLSPRVWEYYPRQQHLNETLQKQLCFYLQMHSVNFGEIKQFYCTSIYCGRVSGEYYICPWFFTHFQHSHPFFLLTLPFSRSHVTSCALGFTLLAQLFGVMTWVAMTTLHIATPSLPFSMDCVLCWGHHCQLR